MGAITLLLVLENIGGTAALVYGPARVTAAAVYVPGGKAAAVYQQGGFAGAVYVPGGKAGAAQ